MRKLSQLRIPMMSLKLIINVVVVTPSSFSIVLNIIFQISFPFPYSTLFLDHALFRHFPRIVKASFHFVFSFRSSKELLNCCLLSLYL